MLNRYVFCFVILSALPYTLAGPRIKGKSKESIAGDCWKGRLCTQRCLSHSEKAAYVGYINNIPVCCPFCERSGLTLSLDFCGCRHNGPDPKYEPTEQELKEVEAFQRQNNSPWAGANYTYALLFGLISVVSK